MEPDTQKVKDMLEACSSGKLHVVETLLKENPVYASQQDMETGASPLMAAATAGNLALCQYLLEAGAPWNAIDRQGQCAGNYATTAEHWAIVNLLVEWGTRAELILGAIERTSRDGNTNLPSSAPNARVEHEPSTKPDYLRQRLQYTEDGQALLALLDADNDAVMMEWERPLMKAHAQVLMDGPGKRVMNIGFGMGIIDSALQELQPELHIIVEAHPDVYKRMLASGWDKKPNVRICFGKWQDCLPKLIAEGVEMDGVFYDTVSGILNHFEQHHV